MSSSVELYSMISLAVAISVVRRAAVAHAFDALSGAVVCRPLALTA